MNTFINETMEAKHGRRKARRASLFDKHLARIAAKQSVIMLKPWIMARNPVMFVTEIGAALTTLVLVLDLFQHREAIAYTLAVAVILWLTVLFANFAEALAEARGKAQANTLKQTRRNTLARRAMKDGEEEVPSDELREGDVVIVTAGEVIPGDGEVI
ncbi:MAG: hypothetical protein WAU91_04590, partial [Desulfatitalea sp.]